MIETLLEALLVLTVNIDTSQRLHDLQDAGAVIETRGLEDWYESMYPVHSNDKPAHFKEKYIRFYPNDLDGPPRLVMQGVGFTPHVFFTNGGLMYVSAALRDALQLDPDDVTYIEVDDSESDPEVRQMGYQIVWFPILEGVVDESRSVRTTWEAVLGDLLPESLFPEFPPHFTTVVLRPDFDPTPGVFFIADVPEGPFVQPEVAQRLAGFEGIVLEKSRIFTAD